MAGRIQLPPRSYKLVLVYVGIQNPFLFLKRSRDNLAVRICNQTQARVDPALDVLQVVGLEIEILWYIVPVKCLTCADDEASSFLRRVTHGRNPRFSSIPCRSNVYLLTPGRQRIAGCGHVILPAEKPTDPGKWKRKYIQITSSRLPPDQAFARCRDHLSVLSHDFAVRTQVEQRVVERRITGFGVFFIDTDCHGYTKLSSGPGQSAHLGPWDGNRVRVEPCIKCSERMRLSRWYEPDPEWIAR